MDIKQFEILVNKLEKQANERPDRYTLKVVLLALLGNAYIGAILLLIVALLGALLASAMLLKALAIKPIIVVGVFLWMIIRALWIKVGRPTGLEVKSGQTPELFKLVDDMRRQVSAPRIHHILITEDLNAAVVQLPRLGVFGWSKNYLLLGLPLMKLLTVDQFKAVLGHEFGHLSKGHGKIANWIYRQRLRWVYH